jgi:hypothetical protein
VSTVSGPDAYEFWHKLRNYGRCTTIIALLCHLSDSQVIQGAAKEGGAFREKVFPETLITIEVIRNIKEMTLDGYAPASDLVCCPQPILGIDWLRTDRIGKCLTVSMAVLSLPIVSVCPILAIVRAKSPLILRCCPRKSGRCRRNSSVSLTASA